MKSIFSQYFFPLSIGFLLLGMGLVLWLGILPLYERVTLQRDEVQKFYTSRENRNRQLAQLSDLRNQYEGIVRDEHVLNILLTDSQIVDFIKIVEDQAAEAQVETIITSQDQAAAIIERKAKKQPAKDDDEAPRTKEPVKTLVDEAPFGRYLPLNISVIGSYENTVLFLHKLETLPIGLDVVSMMMEPHREDAEALSARVETANPFLPVLGDAPTALPPELSEADRLKTTFGVLVYADKKEEEL